ncbi:hypothetical protein HF521_020864 [Silurus meridionalis]|uniref:Uncharacterized protein n=1 Tax=Silurus meridionalis TaxID=175797 RepID=A0A8T0BEL3_SILME|nr:hypothetical protein HF521_020864 [Silurus meridionalis]
MVLILLAGDVHLNPGPMLDRRASSVEVTPDPGEYAQVIQCQELPEQRHAEKRSASEPRMRTSGRVHTASPRAPLRSTASPRAPLRSTASRELLSAPQSLRELLSAPACPEILFATASRELLSAPQSLRELLSAPACPRAPLRSKRIQNSYGIFSKGENSNSWHPDLDHVIAVMLHHGSTEGTPH